MQLLILILSISIIHALDLGKCINISNTICGSLTVDSSIFPNSSVFDDTILKIINGSDSQSLLSTYSGCSAPNIRYSKSFWCFFISKDQSEKCKTPNKKKLCTSTCIRMVKSITKAFNNDEICSQTKLFQSRRDNITATLKKFCRKSTLKTDCIQAVDDEVNNCGFSILKDANEYCKTANDKCCADLSFKEEIMEPIAQVCDIKEFDCWNPFKIGIVVGLVLCVLVILAVLFRKSSKKKKNNMDISVPVQSNDHDYTNYIKDIGEPLNHVWYDSEDSPLSTDSVISTDSSFSSERETVISQVRSERDKKSLSDLFNRGFKIYVAKDDYFAEDSSRLTIRKGDQVVIKEVLSDEFGVGVNLNSTDEGIILLSRLDGL